MEHAVGVCMAYQRIVATLAPYAARYQPVLIFDASKTHVTSFVFAACNRAGIWVVVVPSYPLA